MTTPHEDGYPEDPHHAYNPRYANDPNYPFEAQYPHQVWQGQPPPGDDGYSAYPAYAQYGQYAPHGHPAAAKSKHRGRTAVIVAGAAVLIAGVTVGGVALSDRGTSSVLGNGANPTVQLPGNSGNGSTNGGTSGGSGTLPGGNGTFPFPNGGSTGDGSSSDSRTDATATQSKGIVTIVSVLKYQNAEAAGTGMVLTSNGEILTNNHVIRGATSITVRVVSTGKTYTADVVGTAPTKDVAVIQLRNASGLQTAKVGDASDVSALSKGSSVTGVGNAGGTGTLAQASGSVTALEQSITASDEDGQNPEKLTGLIGTNAGIVSGDSGGPLYDSSGDVIGMDTAASTSRSGTSSAYAIPIDDAMTIADQIESGIRTSSIHIGLPGFIGVGVADANGQGAAITSVLSGGPAQSAGITAGSVITEVGGRSVTSAATLQTALSGDKPGSSVAIAWTDSAGQTHRADVTLMTGPAD